MPNTPKGLTYPSSSSPVAVPADIQELATDVDGLIVPNTGGTYTGSVSFTNSPSVPTPTSGLHAVNKTYADAINTDVTALETELGTNPSGTFSTVADRLNTQDHPASTTDNTIARYDGTQGKLQTSTVAIDDNGRLTTVTGATGGYGFVGGAVHLTGTGTPESVVSAPPGSTFLQTDSVVDVKGWIRWVKSTGTGNTGWIPGPEADTGWRKIVSWTGGVQDGSNQIGTVDTSQYTLTGNGYIAIRRIGQYVEWWVRGGMSKPSTAGSGKLFTVNNIIPAGFRADGGSTYGLSVTAHRECDFLGTNGIGDTPAFASSVGSVSLSWQSWRHFTSNSWPTSLPGTAA